MALIMEFGAAEAGSGGIGKPKCQIFLRESLDPDLKRLPTADPSLYIGKEVYIHKSQKDAVWIVRSRDGRLFLFEASEILLENASFRVDRRLKQSATRKSRRVQHAGVVGTLVAVDPGDHSRRGWTEIDYRPWEMRRFETLRRKQEIKNAKRVFFDSDQRVFAVGIEEN